MLFLILAAFGSPQADEAALRADIECLFVMGAAMGGSAEAHSALSPTLMFYLGRIDGRDPDADIDGAMKAFQREFADGDVRALVRQHGDRCAAQVERAGARMNPPAQSDE